MFSSFIYSTFLTATPYFSSACVKPSKWCLVFLGISPTEVRLTLTYFIKSAAGFFTRSKENIAQNTIPTTMTSTFRPTNRNCSGKQQRRPKTYPTKTRSCSSSVRTKSRRSYSPTFRPSSASREGPYPRRYLSVTTASVRGSRPLTRTASTSFPSCIFANSAWLL